MRLIDAEALKSHSDIDNWNKPYGCSFERIDRQPTAYNLDAVIQQLEDLRDGVIEMSCCPHIEDDDMTCASCYMDRAIEIVKGGGRLL